MSQWQHSQPTSPLQKFFNSVISTEGAKYLGLYIKDFYLNTDLESPEYMCLPITLIPQEIIAQYKLLSLVNNEQVYIKVSNGMYRLPQVRGIAHDLLFKNIAPYGYIPYAHTSGLWQHMYKPTIFVLCVDDFGVKYMCQEDVNHLIISIKTNYIATVDWSGIKYCRITLDWNYPDQWLDMSVTGYAVKALKKLCHPKPQKTQHSPHYHIKTKYGPEGQLVPEKDSSPKVPKETIEYIQAAV
eukprot:518739-Ditylum_brightwellii.AAC.1